MKTNPIQSIEDSKGAFISKQNPITLSDSTCIKQQQKTKHMKTASLPSAIIGRNKTKKQLLSGAATTDIPQLGSLRPNKAKQILLVLTIFLAVMLGFIHQSFGQGTQTFNGNGTFTVPVGVTSITVQVWGGGGRGGARTGGDNVALAGGGGGAFSSDVLIVTPGTGFTVTVGVGSSSTAAGGDSWFGSISTILAKGGSSVADNANVSGIGGLASAGVGATKFNGGNGATGTGGSFGGGGGSSAGQTLIGNYTNTTTNTRTAATAPTGGGNGGIGAANNAAGVAGTAPGGGGGGGYRAGGGSTQNSGNGANGRIIVAWTPCTTPSITTPPSNQNANLGGSVTFSVTGAGTGLSYQWRKGTTNITGATSSSYTISPIASGDAATNYNVVITGSCGTVTSNDVTLSLNPQPSASVTGHTNLTCFGVPGGSITIQASGGSGTGYTFSVDNGATYIGSGNPYTVTGLNANTAYKIRVKDSVGSQSPAIP